MEVSRREPKAEQLTDEGTEKTKDEAVHLRRSIGLLPSISFIIGTVIGSGIFIAPKGVLMNSGSVGVSLIVWILCGVLSLFGSLCYAELGTSFTKSGGHYTYLLETLGPLPAFLRLWTEYLLIRPAVTSYVSLAFGRYAVEPFFIPCAAPTVLVKLVSILAVSFVVIVNCWSVSLTARTQVLLTVIKLFALILIIIPGIMALANGKTANFQDAFDSESLSVTKLPLAFYSGLYAYSGWFYLNFITEEVINPNRYLKLLCSIILIILKSHETYSNVFVFVRTLPLAIIFSIVTVTVFYVLVNVAYYTMMTADELLMSDAVAVTFAGRALQGLAPAMPVLVALSCLGAVNGGFFGSTRMIFVGAREGHMPGIFSMIHIRRQTPLPAILFLYPLVVIMIARGEIYELINFASFSRWFFIALATLGMLIHRYRFPEHPRPFKVPLVIAVVFTLVCFFIVGLSLYSDPWNTGLSCGLTLAVVPMYYLTMKTSFIPNRWKKTFNYFMLQLQILLEVTPQEVQTY
nr:cystine/glutamate transporter-like isoform X1 [Misgurnus anguillicaudatus]XP_055047082.1 cystine/glutamate transporter-like isoform X1 [Misgurnus anguillicaudatus]XP_055047083.1 cystine/glutamate transporter-like isoform X1 [Misgurnus anguillicaudatus]